jgi:hypothetical protein
MRTPAKRGLLAPSREHFLDPTLSGCGRSTPEEMQGEHHNTDNQQNVDDAAGNVEGQESKQPKKN